jgi:hypothetical protein
VEGNCIMAARPVRRADGHRVTKRQTGFSASTGRVAASIPNGTRVDALGWDPAKKMIFIPNVGEGNVTVVHHHNLEEYLDEYIAAGIAGDADAPLF